MPVLYAVRLMLRLCARPHARTFLFLWHLQQLALGPCDTYVTFVNASQAAHTVVCRPCMKTYFPLMATITFPSGFYKIT